MAAKTDDGRVNDQIILARQAAQGHADSRRAVTDIAHPTISHQTLVFCKRFCGNNYLDHICTLEPSKQQKYKNERPLCEWGNGSYAWMLEDLTKPDRLLNFRAHEGAALANYFSTIVNSLPFYERWKDWRFGQHIYVPPYIKRLGKQAGYIFRLLCSGDELSNIAQRAGLSESDTNELAHLIHIELTKRKRLYLLTRPKMHSLTNYGENDEDSEQQEDVVCDRLGPEQIEINKRIAKLWHQLDPAEQFVLEAMVVDELDANTVLEALHQHGISITKGVPAEKTNRQQLYFFRRKALLKLANFQI